MRLTRCKLSNKIQNKLLEFFVLEVMARSAADLLDIEANSAALFYHKLRQIIAYHLDIEAQEVFGGEVELDESYFGGARKGKRGRVAAGEYATTSEAVRDAVRLWQRQRIENAERLEAIRTRIQRSLDDPRPRLTSDQMRKALDELYAQYEKTEL